MSRLSQLKIDKLLKDVESIVGLNSFQTDAFNYLVDYIESGDKGINVSHEGNRLFNLCIDIITQLKKEHNAIVKRSKILNQTNDQAMLPTGMSEFKVRDNKTGLFSTGGWHPSFNSIGKSWNLIRDVRTHFNMLERGNKYNKKITIPSNWEVVEFHLVLKQCTAAIKLLRRA